jgi:S-DNA-T family DNA segregation ATPase FtsK/SpoIIIE
MAVSGRLAAGSKKRRASSKKKQPLFPPSVHQFLARRITDLFGGFQILAGLFLLLAVYSYSGSDVSLNAATGTDDPVNWMGASGAVIADLLVQTLGLVSFLPGILIGFWGGRLLLRKPQTRLSWRLTGLLAGCLLMTVALAYFPSPEIWSETLHFAGTAGVLIFNTLTGILTPLIGASAYGTVFGLSFIAGLVAVLIGFGLNPKEWATVRNRILTALHTGWLTLCGIFYKAMHWHEHYENLEIEKQAVARGEKTVTARPKANTEGTKTPVLGSKSHKMQIIAPKKPDEGKRRTDEQQPKLRLASDTDWDLPPLNLLQDIPEDMQASIDEKALEQNAALLQTVLKDFNIEGDIIKVNPGPIVTLYELEPAPGTKSSRIIGLADDIARSMSAISVRVAVIPGKNAIGIELPNLTRETIYMREMLASRPYELTTAKLPLILGKDIGGEPIIADLARMPHLLVAGTTGSGKSVSINTMLLSLLYRHSPETCRLIMIDPKMLELSVYDDIPHLLTPVVTEPHKAITALKWAVHEMEDRYRAMSKLGVRNVEGYNKRIREAQKSGEIIMHKIQTGFDPETGKPIFEEQPINLVELPYIVIIVDEFADLMLVAGKDVENAIQRLAQMARAAGIHLIMATQRPSVDVITGVIKANFPTRISFAVTSKIDSRTILGDSGAEQLLGMGDMLYMASGGRIKRVHGPFVDDNEVEQVVSFLKKQGDPEYIDAVTDGEEDGGFSGIAGNNGDRDGYDELYDQAVQIVITERKASTSFIQRHLQIGYNRAARIVEQMEKDGLISAANHVGKRDILLENMG